jgi:hypothetical protein
LGEGIQSYTVKWNTDNGTSWTTITGITNDNYTHTGLTAGTTYYYEVFANNQGGEGAASNRDSAATAGTAATPAFKYSITGNDNDVSEDGTSDTTSLNLYLDTAPDGNVVVDITVSDPTELAISSTQLTFTPANYMNTQNWSVTGVDDALDDGDITSQVTISINGAGTTDTTGYASLSDKNKNITTLDDDAAPVLNSVTPSTQTNTLSWNAFPNEAGYRIYWSTSSPVTTSDNLIDNIPTGTTSYQHSGRTAGTTYYYAFMAYTAAGYSSLSNELSGVPTAIAGCTSSGAVADDDPDLLVHYAFEGNLEDIEDTNSDNRYDLTNEEGTMQFAQGCAQGQAAYIDELSGFGVSDNFTSTNVGGNLANDNFSISLWVAKDGDMVGYSSAFNTGFYNEHTPTGDQQKAQIDIDDGAAAKLRMISNSPGNGKKVKSIAAPNMNQWYHVVATHSPPKTVSLYVDGVFQDTNTNMNVEFYGLVVGLNRSRSVGSLNWKGYIDEVKVFGRTFSADDAATDCMKSDNCSYVPQTAPTLSASGRSASIDLTWNLPGGTDNATIYWRTSGGAFESPPTAPTASNNVINVADNQTSYTLTGLTNGDYYHFVIRANNKNGSSPVSAVTGNVQPSSSSSTTWTKALDLDGSSGYARIPNTWNGQNPLRRQQADISPSDSVSSGQTAASGQPWAVAAVFKPTDLSTSRTLWSQSKMESDSRHNDSVKIEIDTNGRIFFNYGDNYNALQWRSANSLITAGNWYGLYVDFNGGSTGVSSGDINRYYSRFQFKLVNLSNGSVTDITSGGSWSHVNSSYGTTQDVGGYFYVGSYVTNTANRFKGQIASTVVTTLRTGQSLPDDTEVAMIVRDPIEWMTTYKTGNPWRKPNENPDYSSNFAAGSATGEQGTKIWLMGDGTNDSSSNIASQVNSSNSGQYLQLNSASTTSVSIPGL